jgi:hypothetical protein
MSTVNINISGVMASGNSANSTTSRVRSVNRSASDLRWRIDSKIRGRNNIDSRLNSLTQSLGKIEESIGNIKAFAERSAENYRSTDTIAKQRSHNVVKVKSAATASVVGLVSANRSKFESDNGEPFVPGVPNAGVAPKSTYDFDGYLKNQALEDQIEGQFWDGVDEATKLFPV